MFPVQLTLSFPVWTLQVWGTKSGRRVWGLRKSDVSWRLYLWGVLEWCSFIVCSCTFNQILKLAKETTVFACKGCFLLQHCTKFGRTGHFGKKGSQKWHTNCSLYFHHGDHLLRCCVKTKWQKYNWDYTCQKRVLTRERLTPLRLS